VEVRRDGEADVLELADALRALERRVAQLESAREDDTAASSLARAQAAEAEVTAPPGEPPVLSGPLPVVLTSAPAFLGRLLVVMGGAYLLRSLTEGERVPATVGAGLGLAYGLALLLAAHRAGLKERRLSASWHGFGAALIILPLLWETSVGFGILSWNAVAALLAGSAGLALGVAWRHRLDVLAGIFTSGACACALVILLPHADAVAPLTLALLVVGLIALWVGRSRGWMGLPWMTALATDFAAFVLIYRTLSDRGPTPALALGLLLTIFLSYTGSLAFAGLRGIWRLGVFDIAQTALVLLLGFGGALRVALHTDTAVAPLGVATLITAVGLYLLGFTVLDRRRRRCFYYLTSIALVLVIAGCATLLDAPAWPWSLLAIGTAFLGRRFGRTALGLHALLYAAAAAFASGLFLETAQGWLGAGGATLPTGSAWAALIALVVVVFVPVGGPPRPGALWRRAAPNAALALLTFAVGGVLLAAATTLTPEAAGAGWQAGARTAALALITLTAAIAARVPQLAVLRFFVPALLAAGAIKLLFEDLPDGVPASLALSFGAYGAVLIAAPRILKVGRMPEEPGEEEAPDDEMPG